MSEDNTLFFNIRNNNNSDNANDSNDANDGDKSNDNILWTLIEDIHRLKLKNSKLDHTSMQKNRPAFQI